MDKNILIIASTSELAQNTIEELKKNPNNHLFATSRHDAGLMDEGIIEFKADITKEEDLIFLKEKLSTLRFDTIINFAGIAIAQAVEELDENELKKQLDVNLFGLLRIIKHLCPYLKENGKLINVSSMASYGIFPFLSPYCLSKASADILLNSYSLESGIKTVSIRPGAVATKFWENCIELNKNYIENNSTNFQKEKKFLVENASKNSLHAQNAKKVALKIAQICELKNPKNVYNIGMDAKFAKFTRFLPQELLNFLIKFILNKRVKK